MVPVVLAVIARSEATKQSMMPPLLDGLLRGACHRARAFARPVGSQWRL